MNNNNHKLGLVLEGGGARGAYHIGVLHALFEAGYKFDGIGGTSIGAVNGVMIAQGKFDECAEMWKSLEFSSFFNVENDYASNLASGKIDSDTIKYFFKFFKDSVKSSGVDTSKMLKMLKDNIDEDLLRNSGCDFGVMTVSLTDRRPKPIFIDEMPKGMVADYVMASASFPGFKVTVVEDKAFIDGGLYDNMPINMMIDRGFIDIVAIETKSDSTKRKTREMPAHIHYITPSFKPGRVMDFSQQSKMISVSIGYIDTIKILRGYIGKRYCIDASAHTPFGYGFADMSQELHVKISSIIAAPFTNVEGLCVSMCKAFKLDNVNIDGIIIEILERVAVAMDINKLKIYKLDQFILTIANLLSCEVAKTDFNSKYMQELLIVQSVIADRFIDSIV